MIKLYHGSTVTVRKPSLRPGRTNADFGKGFYTTSVQEQAERWADIRRDRERRGGAGVRDCRKSRPHDYDLVQGPVANDKVFTTVNLFESGVLSAEAAILQLKAYKTYDQLSFHTAKTIGKLRFVKSFEV